MFVMKKTFIEKQAEILEQRDIPYRERCALMKKRRAQRIDKRSKRNPLNPTFSEYETTWRFLYDVIWFETLLKRINYDHEKALNLITHPLDSPIKPSIRRNPIYLVDANTGIIVYEFLTREDVYRSRIFNRKRIADLLMYHHHPNPYRGWYIIRKSDWDAGVLPEWLKEIYEKTGVPEIKPREGMVKIGKKGDVHPSPTCSP